MDLLASDGFARIELVPPDHLEPGTREVADFMDKQIVGVGLEGLSPPSSSTFLAVWILLS